VLRRQSQRRCEHGSLGGAQMAQLALQQTIPTLQVAMPQVTLDGKVPFDRHGFVSHALTVIILGRRRSAAPANAAS
jgi:hypothetical protein